MGRRRSERTGGIWHVHPQEGGLVQAEIEFFKEELMSPELKDVSECCDADHFSE